jgi:hypothetical protein
MEETKVSTQDISCRLSEESIPPSQSKGEILWREISQKAWFKILYLLVICFTLWNFWQHGIVESVNNINVDFDIYCRWSKHIQSGYPYLLNQRSPQHPCFYYPPFWGIVIAPFTWVPYQTARLIWFGFNVLWLLVFVGLLWKWDRTENPQHNLLYRFAILLLLLNFTPLYESLRHGQANILILLLLTGVLWFYMRKKYTYAGILLGLAAMIKILPLILIAYWLWKKQWKLVGAAFITIFVLGLVTLPLTGFASYTKFFQDNQIYYLFTIDHWTHQSNVSIYSLLREAQSHGLISSHFSMYAIALSFSLMLAIYLIWRIPIREISLVHTGLEYCLILVSLFLMVIYTEHQQYLLVFTAYTWIWIYQTKLKQGAALALIFLSWLFISIGFNLNDLGAQLGIGFFAKYVVTYGIILVWLALILLIGIKHGKKNAN